MSDIHTFLLSKKQTGLRKDLRIFPDRKTRAYEQASLQPGDILINGAKWNELLKCSCVEAPSLLPEPYLKSIRTILENGKEEDGVLLPLAKMMPSEGFLLCLKGYVDTLRDLQKELAFEYYENVFLKQERFLKSLLPTKIDGDMFDEFYEKDTQGSLKSFLPNKKLFTKPIIYDRFGAPTGRLTVSSGPQILTLPKQYRKMFTSAYDGGTVFSFDFTSLEPRVLLGRQLEHNQVEVSSNRGSGGSLIGNVPLTISANTKAIENDVYSWTLSSLGISDIFSREEFKSILLPIIYGAQEDWFISKVKSKQLKNEIDLLEDIRRLFGLDSLLSELVLERLANDGHFITNFYGRRIPTTDVEDYKLVNYWTQSTAVDVALLGFLNIQNGVKELGLEEEVRFLYVLHDALFFDASPIAKQQLKQILPLAKTVEGFPDNFFSLKLSTEKISKNPGNIE